MQQIFILISLISETQGLEYQAKQQGAVISRYA